MILLDTNKKIPIYEQLFLEIRREILEGTLKKDEKLKPIRQMANELGVSCNTVNRAYQQLLSEGYLRSSQGSGFYVEELNITQDRRTHSEKRPERRTPEQKILYDFRYDVFEKDIFPWNKWKKYLDNAIAVQSCQNSVTYVGNKGTLALRKSLASYMEHSRGIECSPDQIILAPGTQYLMDIIASILPKNRYRVGVEEPGYNGMRQVFLNHGYTIRPIPVTDTGMDANYLETTDCNLLYLTPSHQFPTGVTLPLIKRIQILEWARRTGAYVIENDYDNEFLYGCKAQPPMREIDRNDIVIYISTLTKIMTPEIRCAYAVLPRRLLDTYNEKFRYYYAAMPCYEQMALSDFINDDNLMRQARRISVLNEKKKEIIAGIFQRELHEIVAYSPRAAGSHIVISIHLPRPDRLEEELTRHGIRIYSMEPCYYRKENVKKDKFLFGYGAMSADELEEACEEFARLLKERAKGGYI